MTAQGLDEDWSDDSLTADEEVAEDESLLHEIDDAAWSIIAKRHVASASSSGIPARSVEHARGYERVYEPPLARTGSSCAFMSAGSDSSTMGPCRPNRSKPLTGREKGLREQKRVGLATRSIPASGDEARRTCAPASDCHSAAAAREHRLGCAVASTDLRSGGFGR